jgi:hypothetical protein
MLFYYDDFFASFQAQARTQARPQAQAWSQVSIRDHQIAKACRLYFY